MYVSWGSMVRASTLPDQKRQALLKAFGKLKQKVLWKWENDTLPGQPDNLMIKNWMPQNDILGNIVPYVKLKAGIIIIYSYPESSSLFHIYYKLYCLKYIHCCTKKILFKNVFNMFAHCNARIQNKHCNQVNCFALLNNMLV